MRTVRVGDWWAESLGALWAERVFEDLRTVGQQMEDRKLRRRLY